jgi:hypothetical protein
MIPLLHYTLHLPSPGTFCSAFVVACTLPHAIDRPSTERIFIRLRHVNPDTVPRDCHSQGCDCHINTQQNSQTHFYWEYFYLRNRASDFPYSYAYIHIYEYIHVNCVVKIAVILLELFVAWNSCKSYLKINFYLKITSLSIIHQY